MSSEPQNTSTTGTSSPTTVGDVLGDRRDRRPPRTAAGRNQRDRPAPDVPEKSWTNPFVEGTPLHDLFDRRVRNNQDLVILVDDYHNRRGTGKSVASLQLAEGMDQTGEGLTWEKVSLAPEEIREAYTDQPQRSGLLLDEAEVGIGHDRAMSNVNKALREIVSMGRVEEKYAVLNSPNIELIDKHVRALADVWITMLAKGIGLVHFLEYNPYSGRLQTPKKQLIHFRDIHGDHRLRDVYQQLTREKRDRMRGEDGGGFLPEDEHREKLEKAVEEAEREKRNEVLRAISSHPEVQESNDVPHRVLAEAVDLAQPTVSQILNQ